MFDWVSGETLDELLTNAMMFVLASDLEGLSLALWMPWEQDCACWPAMFRRTANW